jgi:hypothetical protein
MGHFLVEHIIVLVLKLEMGQYSYPAGYSKFTGGGIRE